MKPKNDENADESTIKKSARICTWFKNIPARGVLYVLALHTMTVVYIIGSAINLTILAMVKEKPVDKNFNINETLCYTKGNITYIAPINYGGTLDWSLDDQYYILASFYWTYIISHIIGGILTQKFGTKKVYGWSLLTSSICTVCIPFTSHIHYIIVVILQAIQGFVQGLTWPALYAIIGVWIPIHERSRFVTCFQGLTLGSVLANLMAGFVIVKFGWSYVFYLSGGLGLLSTLLWYVLVYNKPEQHPRISEIELHYIQEHREKNLHSQKVIPWISIITSIPVWAIAITSFGRMWIYSIMSIYGPLYFKTVIGVTVEKNGLLLGISSVVAFISALIFSFLSDKVVKHKLLPLLHNRKMFTAFGQISAGIMIFTLAYTSCYIPLIITLWFILQSFHTANFIGSMSNMVDISPSYTAPVSSFVQIVLSLPPILSTLLVKTLLQNESILVAWKKTFQISCGIVFCTTIFYIIFASGKVQRWDVAKKSNNLRNRYEKGHLIENQLHKFTGNT